jgi:hypothetical protein
MKKALNMRSPLPWTGVGMLGLLLVGGLPMQRALAQTAVISVSAQTAQGTQDTGVHEIILGSTQGVNLSFIRTGETITKVWLDDPTRVVIDFDGCLNAAGSGSSGTGTGCNGASFVHIRQLPSPIDFPQELVTGDGGSTLLTMVTSGSSGVKVYQFRLIIRQGKPPYSLIEVTAAPPATPAQLVNISQEYQQTVLRQLSAGLATAEAQGLVDKTSPTYAQVIQCIALMNSGTPFATALSQSGVPRALIDRLRSFAPAASATSPASFNRPPLNRSMLTPNVPSSAR